MLSFRNYQCSEIRSYVSIMFRIYLKCEWKQSLPTREMRNYKIHIRPIVQSRICITVVFLLYLLWKNGIQISLQHWHHLSDQTQWFLFACIAYCLLKSRQMLHELSFVRFFRMVLICLFVSFMLNMVLNFILYTFWSFNFVYTLTTFLTLYLSILLSVWLLIFSRLFPHNKNYTSSRMKNLIAKTLVDNKKQSS